jgi:hypothetical protein
LAAGVSVPEIVIAPKIGAVLPERVVVPEKVIALDVSVELALLTKLPFRSIAFDPALKLPLERVKTPFTVIALLNVSVPVPVFDKLASAVVLEGNSGPVEKVPDAYTTLYAFVVLLGLEVIEPPERVIVPPGVIETLDPSEKMPEVRFKLVISMLEVVGKVAPERLIVSVPSVVPTKPTSDGKVPEPSTTKVEALVTARSSELVGP